MCLIEGEGEERRRSTASVTMQAEREARELHRKPRQSASGRRFSTDLTAGVQMHKWGTNSLFSCTLVGPPASGRWAQRINSRHHIDQHKQWRIRMAETPHSGFTCQGSLLSPICNNHVLEANIERGWPRSCHADTE